MVFWMRTGNEAFFLSTKNNSGFSAPVQIPFGNLNPNLWSGSLGPGFAATGDHVYVVFEVYGDAIYMVHSSDGGATWNAPVAAFVPPQGRRATIPVIATDLEGQPYIAYVNTNASESDAYYGMVRSTDFGTSFLPEVDVSVESNGEEVCECCNGHIAVADNGDVYVSFRNNDSNLRDIWMARSTDGGISFNEAFYVDETDWVAGVCPSNGPHFSILDDEVVNVFFSGSGLAGSGVYYSSFNSMSSQVDPTVDLLLTDVSSSNQNRPRISGSGDTLAVVWQENYNGSMEIALSVSTTGAAGLNSEASRLTDNPALQQQAEVFYANESFHVVYEDFGTGTVMYQEVSFGPLGLSGPERFDFKISPNPSTDLINLTWPLSGVFSVHIIDALGRVVMINQLSNYGGYLSIGHLDAGIYHIRVGNGESLSQARLIVE
jgi:hypothetical protein